MAIPMFLFLIFTSIFATPVLLKRSVVLARSSLHARGLPPPPPVHALVSPDGATPERSWGVGTAALAHTHTILDTLESIVVSFEDARDDVVRELVKSVRPSVDVVMDEVVSIMENTAYQHGVRLALSCGTMLVFTWALTWGARAVLRLCGCCQAAEDA